MPNYDQISQVLMPQKVAAEFRRFACEAFPKEEYGILLGSRAGPIVEIRQIWYPEGRRKAATHNRVEVSADWFVEAAKEAARLGLALLGDIHSHCYDLEREDTEAGVVPSGEDWEHVWFVRKYCYPGFCTFGVCRVDGRNGRKRTRLKFWPVPRETDLTLTREKDIFISVRADG